MRKKLEELLSALDYEFLSEPAWSGHEYAFIYLQEYYNCLVLQMQQDKLSTFALTDAYRAVAEEYDLVSSEKNGDFTCAANVAKLHELDSNFLTELQRASAGIRAAHPELAPDDRSEPDFEL